MMHGPACAVYLRTSMTAAQRNWAVDFLGCAITPLGAGFERDGTELTVTYCVDDHASLADFGPVIGYVPHEWILLSAGADDRSAQLVLARVAAELAEELDGFVNLYGLPSPIEGKDIATSSWDELAPHVTRMIAGVPGRAAFCVYRLDAQRRWAVMCVDAAFLWAWIGHPRFHLT